jgi:hypothetical protein
MVQNMMPLDHLLLSRWWAGAVLMALVAISDYALTLWGARLYRGARGRVAVEGSYELVPMFQADIDAGRFISLRFISVLALMVGFIGLIAQFATSLGIDPPLYLFLVGFFVLIEVPIHVRHTSNIVRFSLLARADAAQGQITFARWFTLKVSSVDFFSFAVLFVLGFAATRSLFLLGGAARCAAFGVVQLILSWKATPRTGIEPISKG